MAFTKIAAAGIDTSGSVVIQNLNTTGVSTLGNTVVGGATTQLVVSGNARITGILTIGTSSVTLDGTNNQVNVGTGVTIHHTNGVQVGNNTLHSSGLTLNTLNVGTGGTIITTTSSGLVGIGTISPAAKLHTSSVSASSRQLLAKFDNQGQQSFYIEGQWGSADIGGSNGTLLYTGGAFGLRTGTSGSANILLDSSGNLGIRLTNPNSPLHVARSSSGTSGISTEPTLRIRNSSAASANSTGIAFERDDGLETAGIYVKRDGATPASSLIFSTSDTNSPYSNAERVRINSSGYVGIATNNPSYRLHVFGSGNQNAITVSGLQNDTDQALFIPKGAINFDSAGTAHIRNSGTTTSELRLSSRGVTTGITFYHGGTGDVTNSGTLSAGIHQSGGVGKFAVGVAYTTSYPASILAREGVISPLMYWPRDYATASGSIGYDELAVGGRVNLKPASEPGSLNTFLHGTFDPGYGSGGENQSWNKFRVIFRLTRHTLSYNNDTITMGLQRYFYSTGWSDIPNSTWTFNGTDSERGSRWTASRWVDYSDWTAGSDVPGFGIKYHSSSPSGTPSSMRVGAVYIQYAYFS